MGKIDIVFTFDKRVLRGAAVAIRSLLDSAADGTLYAVHILHPDLPADAVAAFESMFKGSRHTVDFHKVSPSIFAGMPKNRGSWTEVVYYRFIAPIVLKDVKKAIYSDVDVFFREDLSPLFNMDIENSDFAAVRAERNAYPTTGHKFFPENKNEYIYWSGLLLLNCEKMRRDRFFEKLCRVAREFGKRLKLFDLDAMNIASTSIAPVPFRYVTLETVFEYPTPSDCNEYRFLKDVYSDAELAAAKSAPAIIHYAGDLGKPWQRPINPEYWERTAHAIPRALDKKTFRDFRKLFFYSKKKAARLKTLFKK